MTHPTRRYVPAAVALLSSMALVRVASAETHRVAAVDPDAELARALDIALSPWGAAVTEVRVDRPGATVALPIDRARDIASATHADVVMWVSENAGRSAAWIYDVASDHASLRELSSSPPFDAATAAAVALSVKALLRFTVVAPPPERFGAAFDQPTWAFGLSASLATHFGDQDPEARAGPYVSFWPESLHHKWGLFLSLASGLGVSANTSTPAATFSGTLSEYVARLAIGARLPLRLPIRTKIAIEPSLGVAGHFFSLRYVVGDTPARYSQHFAGDIDMQLALTLTLFSGFAGLAPWVGASLLNTSHDFYVGDTVVLRAAAFTAEGGVRAEFALP
jgi:hypothetical protein